MKVIIDGVEYVPRITVDGNDIPPLRKLLSAARAASHLSLRDVAERTGMSYNTVFNAECDGTVSLVTALKLGEIYGIDFNSIAKCLLKELRKEGKIK